MSAPAQDEDVNIHNPRRHDENGLWTHRLSRRAVLDELDQVIAKNDPSRGDGHGIARAEMFRTYRRPVALQPIQSSMRCCQPRTRLPRFRARYGPARLGS